MEYIKPVSTWPITVNATVSETFLNFFFVMLFGSKVSESIAGVLRPTWIFCPGLIRVKPDSVHVRRDTTFPSWIFDWTFAFFFPKWISYYLRIVLHQKTRWSWVSNSYIMWYSYFILDQNHGVLLGVALKLNSNGTCFETAMFFPLDTDSILS